MANGSILAHTLRDQIVEQVRNDVLCGRLKEGERITLMQLVERFGVSRTPVREALQLLAHEGLLEGRPNAGVKVSRRPPDTIRELVIPIRRKLETFALRTFFDTISDTDFQIWNEILEKMRLACAARDYPMIAEQDVAFHRSIIRRAGERDLEAIWNSIVALVRHHFWDTQRENYSDPLEIYHEHVRIVKAFRSGDVEASVEALDQNIA